MFFLYFLVLNCFIYNCYTSEELDKATIDSNEYTIKLLIVIDPEVKKIPLLPGVDHTIHIFQKLKEAAELFKRPGLDQNIKISVQNVIEQHVDSNGGVRYAFSRWVNQVFPSDGKFDYALYFTPNIVNGNSFPSKITCQSKIDAGVINFKYKAFHDGLYYTIAVQLAYSLGIPSSGESNPCGFVVAGLNGEEQWSKCSKEALATYLRSPSSKCLRKKLQNDLLEPLKLEKYTKIIPRKQVCEHITGSKYTFNNQITPMNSCAELVCINYSNNDSRSWTMNFFSEINGIECGPSAMCMHRKCAQISELTPINGGWTHWQPVAECTHGCGGGERRMERYCTNPKPMYGGEYCSGENTKYEMCNMEPCTSDNQDVITDSRCNDNLISVKTNANCIFDKVLGFIESL